MAKEAAKPEPAAVAPAPPPPAKQSKKLLIIIIALLVIILGLLAAGGFLFFMKKHDAEADAEGDDEEEIVEPVKKPKPKPPKEILPPVYMPMDAFTVNLASEGGAEQFMQLVLSVEVEDPPAGKQFELYTPKIRNNVMLLLSSKKASELMTREGKEKLAMDIRDQMNKVLDPRSRPGDDTPVKEVLFTSFIIQ